MLFFFVKWNPFTPAILHQGRSILIPHNHPVHRINQSCTGPCNFVIHRRLAQSPGSIDTAIGTAHGTFIVEVEAGGGPLSFRSLPPPVRHAQARWAHPSTVPRVLP